MIMLRYSTSNPPSSLLALLPTLLFLLPTLTAAFTIIARNKYPGSTPFELRLCCPRLRDRPIILSAGCGPGYAPSWINKQGNVWPMEALGGPLFGDPKLWRKYSPSLEGLTPQQRIEPVLRNGEYQEDQDFAVHNTVIGFFEDPFRPLTLINDVNIYHDKAGTEGGDRGYIARWTINRPESAPGRDVVYKWISEPIGEDAPRVGDAVVFQHQWYLGEQPKTIKDFPILVACELSGPQNKESDGTRILRRAPTHMHIDPNWPPSYQEKVKAIYDKEIKESPYETDGCEEVQFEIDSTNYGMTIAEKDIKADTYPLSTLRTSLEGTLDFDPRRAPGPGMQMAEVDAEVNQMLDSMRTGRPELLQGSFPRLGLGLSRLPKLANQGQVRPAQPPEIRGRPDAGEMLGLFANMERMMRDLDDPGRNRERQDRDLDPSLYRSRNELSSDPNSIRNEMQQLQPGLGELYNGEPEGTATLFEEVKVDEDHFPSPPRQDPNMVSQQLGDNFGSEEEKETQMPKSGLRSRLMGFGSNLKGVAQTSIANAKEATKAKASNVKEAARDKIRNWFGRGKPQKM